MKLYHGTSWDAWQHIQVEGLQSRIPKSEGGWGLVYLAPTAESAERWGEVILEVETGDLRLTAFEDCKEWEILCWGEIPPGQVQLHQGRNTSEHVQSAIWSESHERHRSSHTGTD